MQSNFARSIRDFPDDSRTKCFTQVEEIVQLDISTLIERQDEDGADAIEHFQVENYLAPSIQ